MKRLIALLSVLLLALGMTGPAFGAEHCQDTGVGLDANYVNEVPDEPFTVTCDVGIFFDENGRVEDAVVRATAADARSSQYGVYVYDARVNVTNTTVDVDEDYPHEFVSVAYLDGSSGRVTGNELDGAHRVGVLLRGAGTNVTVSGNAITGTGKKTSNWAENGIQIDQGASGIVRENTVEDHYWGLNNFSSSGILVLTDGVNVQRNTIGGNDLGLWVGGDNNNVIHNTIKATDDPDVGVWNDGVFIEGDNNGLRQNTLINERADNGDVGVWVFGNRNKLIRNDITGWGFHDVHDGGEGTVRPRPFQ